MNNNKVKNLHEVRGMVYKGDFLECLSDDELNNGCIKFNIIDFTTDRKTTNCEEVLGWVTPEDKEKVNDDNFDGEITAILCSTPLNYCGILFLGTELKIKCNKSVRPSISYNWMNETIFNKDWYNSMNKNNPSKIISIVECSQEDYDNSKNFMLKKFEGMKRLSGEPLSSHSLEMADILKESGYGLDYQIVALLHDVLEDSDANIYDLYNLGLDQRIIIGIIKLTRTEKMSLEDSLLGASKNNYAKLIKGVDRYQNAKSTSITTNTKEFIIDFIYKTMRYYYPYLIENPFFQHLVIEIHRLNCEVEAFYTDMITIEK